MAKLNGLFDSFDNLDQIDTDGIISWLKPSPQVVQLENYLANRILYPASVPLSEYDMKLDLAILREALKLNGPKTSKSASNELLGDNPFLNITLRKILIPDRFLNFVPDLVTLCRVFIEGLLLTRKKEDFFWDLWTIVLVDDVDEIVGSLIMPQFNDKPGEINLNVSGKNYKIRSGASLVVPCDKDRCEVSYKVKNGKILGKEESALELYGGKLGIIVEGRLI